MKSPTGTSIPMALALLGLALLAPGTEACRSAGQARRDGVAVRNEKSAAIPSEIPAVIRPSGTLLTYNFDQLSPGGLPETLTSTRTGRGPLGNWRVVADESAPSRPNVLAQLSTDSIDYRFPIVVSNEGAFKDLDLSVRFKPVSGSIDEAGGLVFRYKDAQNYYVVRANALEDNFRLYRVVNGSRSEFAGTNTQVTPNQWHEIKVACDGSRITCSFDGRQLISASDETFKDAGKVGVWTKADSVTYFDDLSVGER